MSIIDFAPPFLNSQCNGLIGVYNVCTNTVGPTVHLKILMLNTKKQESDDF